jgi:hypothetical protein
MAQPAAGEPETSYAIVDGAGEIAKEQASVAVTEAGLKLGESLQAPQSQILVLPTNRPRRLRSAELRGLYERVLRAIYDFRRLAPLNGITLDRDAAAGFTDLTEPTPSEQVDRPLSC